MGELVVTEPHRNDMSHWSDVACTLGHTIHQSVSRHIVLCGPTRYADYPAIPGHLCREFDIRFWDPERYPVGGNPAGYCPAFDAVSETFHSHAVWEPADTIVALTAFHTASPGSYFLDFGAHVGWFSLLAASTGVPTLAYEADPENLRLLELNASINGWSDRVTAFHCRVRADTKLDLPDSIRLAKIDVEGAEGDVINVLWPAITSGRVDQLIVEVSPVFADYYPDLVLSLIDQGYRAYRLNVGQHPPIVLEDLERDLAAYRLDEMSSSDLEEYVKGCHQVNIWFTR